MNSNIRISCIIVTYNSENTIKDCVSSIKASDIPTEIIIVDNNSVDNTPNILKDLPIKYVLLDNNIGFGQGINRGVKEADTEFLFIINPDTKILPDTLSKLLKFADSNDQWGIIAPRLNNPDGTLQISARNFPNRLDFFLGRGSPLTKLGFSNEKKAGYVVPENNEPFEAQTVPGTAMFINREMFLKLNGFDDSFFLYVEDIDLCKRMSEAGKKIFLISDSIVVHIWRESSKSRPFFSSYNHYRSVYKYFKKHYPKQVMKNLILLLALLSGFIVSILMMALKLRGKK